MQEHSGSQAPRLHRSMLGDDEPLAEEFIEDEQMMRQWLAFLDGPPEPDLALPRRVGHQRLSRSRPRARGAGRPAGRSSRRGCTSGSDPGDPEPPDLDDSGALG